VGLSHKQLKTKYATVHLCHDGKKGDHVQSEGRVEQSSWNTEMFQLYYKLID
jgi:hypothetical protein